MISIQTNVDSLTAQQNLNLDNLFESTTINQLTSGYRINKSGDDAAGLAVANGIQSEISQLTQGVNNANNGVSQLQIVDGGLSNISTILNRMQTLATQSASATFTGSRATLNKEYAGLIAEITRQAANINMNAGGSFNQNLSVFIGGGSGPADSTISVDLSGSNKAVDALSLGLTDTNVLGGGTSFIGNTLSLNTGNFLSGSTSENFQFNVNVNGVNTKQTITVQGSNTGISGADVLAQLNTQLGASQLGITASQDSNGALTFSSSNAFDVTDLGTAATFGTAVAPALLNTAAGSASSVSNNGLYLVQGSTSYAPPTSPAVQTLTFQTNGQNVTVNVDSTNATPVDVAKAINAATTQYGIYAVVNAAGNGVDFQSNSTFTVKENTADILTGAGPLSPANTPTGVTLNADKAITAIESAIQLLGLTQGVVGAGENTLSYAINLAQSQIANFSSAESSIKDANVATQAANLSKSQVLTQTAIAAMAQANSEPQAVLKLLQG